MMFGDWCAICCASLCDFVDYVILCDFMRFLSFVVRLLCDIITGLYHVCVKRLLCDIVRYYVRHSIVIFLCKSVCISLGQIHLYLCLYCMMAFGLWRV